jgi:hypothetical protein
MPSLATYTKNNEIDEHGVPFRNFGADATIVTPGTQPLNRFAAQPFAGYFGAYTQSIIIGFAQNIAHNITIFFGRREPSRLATSADATITSSQRCIGANPAAASRTPIPENEVILMDQAPTTFLFTAVAALSEVGRSEVSEHPFIFIAEAPSTSPQPAILSERFMGRPEGGAKRTIRCYTHKQHRADARTARRQRGKHLNIDSAFAQQGSQVGSATTKC